MWPDRFVFKGTTQELNELLGAKKNRDRLMEGTPSGGFKGLVQHWKSDLIAAVSVALIALPLSLGIALAAGAPAMAGIFSAVVGGVVTAFYRGGHISVNGPAKGVIGVILLGIVLMDDDTGL